MICLLQRATGPRSDHSAHLALLLSLLFAFTLPAFDHHAIEREPDHGHVALGGSETALVLAAEAHSHPFEHTHRHTPAANPVDGPGAQNGSSLLFLPNDDASGSLLTVAQTALMAEAAPIAAPPLFTMHSHVNLRSLLPGDPLDAPLPPPRSF